MNLIKKTLSVAFVFVSMAGIAQSINQNISEKNGKVSISVSKEENGKKEFFQKSYDTKGMTNTQKQSLIDHVLDSLNLGSGKNVRITTKIEADDNHDLGNNDQPRKKDIIIKKRKKINGNENANPNDEMNIEIETDGNDIDINGLDFDFKDLENSMGELGKTLKFKFRDLEPQLRRLGDEMEPKLRKLGDDLEPSLKRLSDMDNFNFNFDNSSKTVKSLNAYPNIPSNNKLNVRFHAPEKGDITITVTDVAGKEVGKEKIAGFSGDYLGQIDLKANAKGTVFVTVTQGDDGTVKRVVIK
jgi:hypothetical protein